MYFNSGLGGGGGLGGGVGLRGKGELGSSTTEIVAQCVY